MICEAILKSGVRKGKACGIKDCKRHGKPKAEIESESGKESGKAVVDVEENGKSVEEIENGKAVVDVEESGKVVEEIENESRKAVVVEAVDAEESRAVETLTPPSLIDFFLIPRIEYSDEIFPPKELVFRAFKSCPEPRVVILGQDPYHDGSANGLAFSTNGKVTPSLRNVFKEIERSFGKVNRNPDLERFAVQGVLLLNTALTVRKSEPGSHLKLWRPFISNVISVLNLKKPDIVWLIWGTKAKSIYMDSVIFPSDRIIYSCHPSPLAGNGFYGSNCFVDCNKILREKYINWWD